MNSLPTASSARRRCARLAGLFLAVAAFAGVAVPAAAGPRLDRINESKVLRVGTPGDYRPFAIEAADGYSGHDIDLIERIAKELGAKIEYVPTTWKTLLPDLQADKFDVAVGGITRTAARIGVVDMLPGYAPFGKVALIRAELKGKLTTLDSLNQPGVHVIKNPGGTNEQFVLANLKNAQVSTHEKNAEIPGLIAEGKGDVMITETYEALHYAKADPRLFAAFIDAPLTPPNMLGFMLPKDDPDYMRVMHFVWGLLVDRGVVRDAAGKWLK
ncbi:MAG: transporter substrate-binding domain-containing protein [Lautropia sp.]